MNNLKKYYELECKIEKLELQKQKIKQALIRKVENGHYKVTGDESFEMKDRSFVGLFWFTKTYTYDIVKSIKFFKSKKLSACLKTVVDKNEVNNLIKNGILDEKQLQKIRTKNVSEIHIKVERNPKK